jgi:two-component system cell cycle sensor histidine kinase/response regulator CckA
MNKIFKLNKRLFAAMIGGYLIVLSIYVYWDYTNAKKNIIAGIDKELYNSAATLKYVLPNDFHDRAVDSNAISVEEDKSTANKLTMLIRETGFKYAYTIVKQDDSLFFIASDISANPDTKRGTFYYYKYKEADESFYKAFDQKEPIYKTVSDQWGTVRTVMIPEKSKGGVSYLACVDHDIGHVKELLRDNVLKSIFSLLFFIILVVPIFIIFARLHSEYTKSLRESDQRFNLAMNATRDGLWDWNIITNEIYYSPGWKKMLGYEYDELPNDFTIWEKLTAPEDVERSWEIQQELINRKRERFEIEFKMKHKNGHWVDILSRANAFFDKDGKAVRMVGTHVDITERNKAVEELLRSEERNRLLLEQVNAVVWTVDRELRFTSSRGAGLKKLNLASDQVVGLNLHSFLGTNDDAPSIAAIEKTFEGESVTYEEMVGGYIWESHAEPLRNSAGDIIGSIIVSLDITEQKSAEIALKESEEKFRLAFDASPDSININRASDGLYLDINEGFSNLMGYSREEVIGKTSTELNIWKSPEDHDRLVKELKGSGFAKNLEVELIDKNGKIHTALMSARFLRIGDEEVILTITRDITKRIRAKRELQQSEERYRSLVENTLNGYFICEIPTCRFIFLNKRICDLFGYDMHQGLKLSIWDVIDSQEQSLVRERIEARIAGRQPAFTSNIYTVVQKGGSRIKAEVSTSLITYQGNAVIQGLIRDVTETQRLQHQLQQAQKFEAIGTLAGGIAHDFNNLLMGIQGRTSLIAMDLDPSHPSYEHAKAVEEHVRSATDLTSQLLGIARGGKYDVKPVDLTEMVQKSAQMFGRTKKEIRIHIKFHELSPIVAVDRRQIEQVLLNLFINAWQAMPEGGELYLETCPVNLDAKFCEPHEVKPGQYGKVSVSDNGIGIDASVLDRIFDPFFTTKEKERGTGLGLASAYGIIKNHGGLITVYSEVGHGTTFNIYLPVSTEKPNQEPTLQEELARGEETILLVDDESLILEVGYAMLERLGYEVVVAKGGGEAVKKLEERSACIDLVILDLIMPDMDGSKTFDLLRAIAPEIRIILSSGYSINGQANAVIDKGCNGFIQKPFNISELSKIIRNVLDS